MSRLRQLIKADVKADWVAASCSLRLGTSRRTSSGNERCAPTNAFCKGHGRYHRTMLGVPPCPFVLTASPIIDIAPWRLVLARGRRHASRNWRHRATSTYQSMSPELPERENPLWRKPRVTNNRGMPIIGLGALQCGVRKASRFNGMPPPTAFRRLPSGNQCRACTGAGRGCSYAFSNDDWRAKYREDRAAYTIAKSAFIESVLEKAASGGGSAA